MGGGSPGPHSFLRFDLRRLQTLGGDASPPSSLSSSSSTRPVPPRGPGTVSAPPHERISHTACCRNFQACPRKRRSHLCLVPAARRGAGRSWGGGAEDRESKAFPVGRACSGSGRVAASPHPGVPNASRLLHARDTPAPATPSSWSRPEQGGAGIAPLHSRRLRDRSAKDLTQALAPPPCDVTLKGFMGQGSPEKPLGHTRAHACAHVCTHAQSAHAQHMHTHAHTRTHAHAHAPCRHLHGVAVGAVALPAAAASPGSRPFCSTGRRAPRPGRTDTERTFRRRLEEGSEWGCMGSTVAR